MTLRPAPLALQFSGGVDLKTDSKQVQSTKLLDLQNCTFKRASTLSKRNGYLALSRSVDGGGTYGSVRGVAERDGEMLLFDDQNCYSRRSSSSTWAPAGAVSVGLLSDAPIARTGTQQSQPDIATNGGVTACAWEDSRGGVWCSVLEDATGRILLTQQLDAAGSVPRCVAVGAVLHVLWINGTDIWLSIVNPANAEAALVGQIITTDLDPANSVYDAEPSTITADLPAVIAWSTPNGYRVGYLVAAGVLGSPLYGVPSVATVTGFGLGVTAISVSYSASVVVVGLARVGGNAFGAAHTSNALATVITTSLFLAAGTWIRITGAIVGGAWWFAVEKSSGRTDQNTIESGSLNITTFAAGALATLHGHCIATRSFVDNLDVYVNVIHAVRFYPYAATIRLSGGNACVARMLPGLSSGMLLRNHLPSVQTSSRIHSFPLCYRIQLSSANGDQFGEQGIRRHTLDLGSAPYVSAQLGRGLYLAGALPLHYDGSRWAEADFHAAPDYGWTYTLGGAPTLATLTIVTGASQLAQSAGGGLTVLNAYQYTVWYEEIDAQGELHPGATGVAMLVTLTGGNGTVTLTVPTCRLTGKRRVRISIARTVGDAGPGKSFRITSTSSTSGQYLLNDPTVDSLTFVDALDDATLQTHEPLYTNGGILSNDPVAVAGGVLAGGKSRLFWTHPDDPNLVCYSQQLRDDTAVEMSAALTVRLDPYGGGVVAIAVMDDTVLCYKGTSIYGFSGPGPDADGGATSNNAWSNPVLITSDVGCTDPGSICQSPLGIVFKSAKGFKLLGRDQQVVDIGADVFGLNAQRVSRATLLPDRHQIVFLSPLGYTLLWDYEFKQWSKYSNHCGLDALVLDGQYNYLRTDGRVFLETIGQYKDDSSHIPMLIRTAWIKATGYLQGWQRIFYATVIGSYLSEHQLQARYQLDYQDSYFTLPPANVDGNYAPYLYGAGPYGVGPYGGAGGPSTVYQRTWHINKRCQAISFEFSDVENSTSFGAAFELSELLLTGGVLAPRFRPGAARQG